MAVVLLLLIEGACVTIFYLGILFFAEKPSGYIFSSIFSPHWWCKICIRERKIDTTLNITIHKENLGTDSNTNFEVNDYKGLIN